MCYIKKSLKKVGAYIGKSFALLSSARRTNDVLSLQVYERANAERHTITSNSQ